MVRAIAAPVAGLAGLAWLALGGPADGLFSGRTASAQEVRGIPEEDPFADELNPFGRGKPAEKKPAAPGDGPKRPAQAPAEKLQLPLPFPERTVPGERAERRRPTAGKMPAGGMPAPEDRQTGRGGGLETGRQPRPFEDVPEDFDDGEEKSPAEELLAKADALDRQGRFEESRDVLEQVVKLDPNHTVGHLALGVVLRRLGDYEAAVESYSRGLAIDAQEPELYLRRGIAWFHMGLYGIAMEDFEDAAGIAYDDPRPELWRGLTLMELGRPLEAINAYASAIRRDRGFMLAYLNRGLAYLATNEPRKAEFDFDQAIRHDPRDVRAWFNRGVAQARQGELRDAIESYDAALKVDPKHEPSRRNREATQRLMRRSARPSARAS
jgi:tetratricopeptide (TPR) repeat protein